VVLILKEYELRVCIFHVTHTFVFASGKKIKKKKKKRKLKRKIKKRKKRKAKKTSY